ncbi:MAG: epoxyqueuosine reductase QueH [Clostridiales bacterium]|nr:epoxyqueuosine reductase QueH [Candidatus Crickella merdequi]
MSKDAKAAVFNSADLCRSEDFEFQRISLEGRKPRLLLHACCGPCSTSCVERLADEYSITLYYYNPNITDSEEYFLRRDALLKFIKAFNEENKAKGIYVDYLEGKYEPAKFISMTAELKEEPEGGRRCDICFTMRLTDTAVMAKKMGMDYFTTTMSVSPHKSYKAIAELGYSLQDDIGISYLDVDFKKKNGFGRSVELSKQYGLYRQNFCGCDYARYAGKDKKED